MTVLMSFVSTVVSLDEFAATPPSLLATGSRLGGRSAYRAAH
jgi:hypothetical protein